MVKASEKLVMVVVDCSDAAKSRDLMAKYGVRGFPTMVFTNPDGTAVGMLGSREPAAVARQFIDLADRFRKKFEFVATIEAALAEGKNGPKPVLIFFADASPGAAETDAAFADDTVQALLGRFVVTRHEVGKDCDLCKRFKAGPGVGLLVVNPCAEDPAASPVASVVGKQAASTLKTNLEGAVRKWEALWKQPPAAAGAEAPAVPAPPAADETEKQCRMWLLLARNFINQRDWAKAEENLKRVLAKRPEGKLAEEAKALLKDVEAGKGP